MLVLVGACDSSTHPAVPSGILTLPNLADTTLATLTLPVDTSLAYVGRHLHLQAQAKDSAGNPVDVDQVEITSSNSGVAEFVQKTTELETFPGGRTIHMADVEFVLVGAGSTTFHARLGNLNDDVTLSVNVMPPTTHALVVDSFYVVEQRETPQPYLVYWPVLRLREPTGTSYATVIGVYFSVPAFAAAQMVGVQQAWTDTGLCKGALRFAPGASDYAYYVHDYLWSNDFVMISLNGTPVPDGSAFARVIVQDSQGQLGTLEVTGPIFRGSNTPAVPTTDSPYNLWAC